MKKNYLITAFQKTLSKQFPAQAAELDRAFQDRLNALRAENAGATAERQRHLEGQILPGIAAYEVLQRVMPKEEALKTVHGYVEERAWKLKKNFLKLMKFPGFY